MSGKRTRWVASALCFVSACASSPPVRYYTLSDIAPDARLTAPSEDAPVRVDRVTIPSELDRSQVVRRIDANRLQIAELDRWAGPLDEMIRRVLSADLAARLPEQMVADPNEPALGERRRLLSVDILEFYGDASCAVTLRAGWVIKQPAAPSVRGTEEAHVPSNGCDGALPATMSRALAQLSDRIAASVARAHAP
jgi:uncharacterized lipoprotein YmbA